MTLLFQNDEYLGFKDEMPIFGDKNVGDYLNGDCHLFVIVACALFKAPITCLFDTEPMFDDPEDAEAWENDGCPPVLVHAWLAPRDGYGLDARGLRPTEAILADYEDLSCSPELISDGVGYIFGRFARQQLHDFERGEMPAIADHLEHYQPCFARSIDAMMAEGVDIESFMAALSP